MTTVRDARSAARSTNGAHSPLGALMLALAGPACAPLDADADRTHGTSLELVSMDGSCDGAPGIGQVGWSEARGIAEVDEQVPPRLHLALGVDDAAIHARVPSYDGARERAFACVPVRPGPYGGGPRFRRVDLAWREAVPHGGRTIDVHRASVEVTTEFDTPSWSWTRGVYFGLESPTGVVWAQWPGDDVTVRSIGRRPPTERPLP